jgi:hypothetical protein
MDASTRDWIETLGAIGKARAGWKFVPGHGDVGTSEDVGAFREYLMTLRKLVADAQATGKSGDGLADTVIPGLKDKYGSWERNSFEYFAKQNISDIEAELNGKKRVPESTQADR